MTLLTPAEAVGKRVKLRGRKPAGVIARVDDRRWTWVGWDEDSPKGPWVVMLSELEVDRAAHAR